jgi:hypothetical protein
MLMPRRKVRILTAVCLTASGLSLSFLANAPSRASAPSPASTSPEAITPGVPWADASGSLLQGHNGSIVSVRSSPGTTYYWFGQDMARFPSQQGVACYSSTDLVHWAFRGDVLTPSSQKIRGWPSQYQIRTVKVLYNRPTKLYTLWASVATGKSGSRRPADFKVDVATSHKICGRGVTYKWVGRNRNPQPFQPLGHPSGDIGLFQDANGTAYLLSEDLGVGRSGVGKGLYIYALSPRFTVVERIVKHFSKDNEAPAMFKHGGTYYVFASYKTNWVPNDNQYTTTTARSLTASDTWSAWATLVPTARKRPDPRTCVSQTMFVLPVQGKEETTYIYIGDRWDSAHFNDSGYVWLPISFTKSTSRSRPSIDCSIANWSVNTMTGRWHQLIQPYFTFTNVGSADLMENPSGQALDASPNDGRTYQHWKIVNVDVSTVRKQSAYTPYYVIENASSQKVLKSTAGGLTAAPLSSSGATEAQEWEFVSVLNAGKADGLTLVNRATRKVVAQQAGGKALDQEPPGSKPNQQWALSEVPGYWAVTIAGAVYHTAGTPWFGSLPTQKPANVAGFVPTEDGSGYWVIKSNGKVTNFGDAASVRGVGGVTRSCPLVGATADPAHGFWAFDRCGGVHPLDGATSHGSKKGHGLTFVGLAATHNGGGYWLIDRNGTVYPLGNAGKGSFTLGNSSTCPVASAITAPAGGFWALTDCGAVIGARGATSLGDESSRKHSDFTKLAAIPDGGGYWLFEQPASGAVTVYRFGDATQGTQTGIGPGTLTATVGDPTR